jgi:hypothetical protein
MNIDFVQETAEEEGTPRGIGSFTGWEGIIFEIEDDEGRHPERSEGSQASPLETLRRLRGSG